MRFLYAHQPHNVQDFMQMDRQAQKRFVVYYEGGFSSLDALRAALTSWDGNTEIIVVAFIPVPSAQAELNLLDWQARADAVLAGAEVNASVYGVPIITKIISGNSKDTALAAFAVECGAEKVFIGRDHEDNWTEKGMAQYLLKDVPLLAS
ncbi:MAG: universal stress protein [Chloroflexi bacterium]|nr:universal stress protein [Chloroflexota bacterium]